MIQSSNTVESIEIVKNYERLLVAIVEVLNFKPYSNYEQTSKLRSNREIMFL